MSTSAAEVSIHAVSPESILAASADWPVAARPRTAATTTAERVHHALPPNERVPPCMLSLLLWMQRISQVWCHEKREARKGTHRGARRDDSPGCLVCRRRLLFVQIGS